jgi:glutamine amidotransferase
MIAVVDYGAGNLRSVVNALEALGRTAVVADGPAALARARAIILPGVGAFGDGMEGLRKRDLVDPLTEAVLGRRVPYLGICLGLQFLAREGFEHGSHEGLGWIPGVVRRIESADPRIKVPHIGWNDVDVRRRGILLDGVDEPVFYFVHGYYFSPDPETADVVTSTCVHGVTVTATLERDNIFAAQFHPEKSQRAGLRLLENFLRAAGV